MLYKSVFLDLYSKNGNLLLALYTSLDCKAPAYKTTQPSSRTSLHQTLLLPYQRNIYRIDVPPLLFHHKCRPTVCVTRRWAGRDNATLMEPASSHANCSKTRRLPPVGCTLCWAGLGCERLLSQSYNLCLEECRTILFLFARFFNSKTQTYVYQ